MKGFVNYIKNTYINKLITLGMIMGGYLIYCFENDITILAISILLGIPLFFIRKNLF